VTVGENPWAILLQTQTAILIPEFNEIQFKSHTTPTNTTTTTTTVNSSPTTITIKFNSNSPVESFEVPTDIGQMQVLVVYPGNPPPPEKTV